MNSLEDDAHVSLPRLDENIRIVYQKKSHYDRELFAIDDKNFYGCGELSKQSSTSTEDVLNFDVMLVINKKHYPSFVEIPAVVSFGVESLVIRESSRAEDRPVLNCKPVSASEIDSAFIETIGSRLQSLSIQLKESADNKKKQEKAVIWGSDWKAKTSIDSERNSYLRTLKNCTGIDAINSLRLKIEKELKLIK